MIINHNKNLFLLKIVCSLFGILSFILTFLSTSKYGIGLTPDSYHYITSGINLFNGEGFQNFSGQYLVNWPPFYALICGFVSKFFSPDIILGLRILHSFFSFFLLFLSIYLFFLLGMDLLGIIFLGFILCFSNINCISGTFALSEGIFTILLIVSFILFVKYCDNNNIKYLILLSVIVSFFVLTRYIGIIYLLPITFGLFFLSKNRLKDIFIFNSISLLPTLVWFIRNYFYYSSGISGNRMVSHKTFFECITNSLDVISGYLISFTLDLNIRILLFLIIISFIIICVIYFKIYDKKVNFHLIILLFMFVYYGSITIMSALTHLDKLPQRYFAPLYPFFMGLFILYSNKLMIVFLEKNNVNKKLIFTSLFFMLLAISLYPVKSGGDMFYEAYINGPGGYTSMIKNEGSKFKEIYTSINKDRIFSNSPDGLYFIGLLNNFEIKKILWVPGSTRSDNDIKSILHKKDRASYLVWFKTVNRSYLVSPYRLDKLLDFNAKEKISSIGVLYEIKLKS